MSEQETLKQIIHHRVKQVLEEKFGKEILPFIETLIQMIIEEWLTQKRQGLKIFDNGELVYNAKLEELNELLEDFKN